MKGQKSSSLLWAKVILCVMPLIQIEARKTYLARQSPEARYTPKLQQYSCSSCAFDNDSGKLCLDQTVTLDMGWRFDQQYNQTDSDAQTSYSLMYGFYAEPALSIHPELVINFLYAQDYNIDLTEFVIEVFVQVAYYWNNYFCVNLGWYTEEIELTVETAVSFQDCYKDVLLTYCDFTNWTDQEAKWIDECQDSNTEQVTVYEFVYDPSIYMWNNRLQNQVTCWPGYLGEYKSLLSVLTRNFFEYLRDQYQNDRE